MEPIKITLVSKVYIRLSNEYFFLSVWVFHMLLIESSLKEMSLLHKHAAEFHLGFKPIVWEFRVE